MKQRAKPRKNEPMVPSQPFADWLNQTAAAYETELPADAINEDNDNLGPAQRLAGELGWGATETGTRRLYRFRNQIQETGRGSKVNGTFKRVTIHANQFTRSVVEDACHQYDPHLFYQIYPEFAHETDITLEPDVWCPFCRTCDKHPEACPKSCRHASQRRGQMVTPIGGLCPFCECEHGHRFREVGVSDDGFACLACAKEEQRERQRASVLRQNERRRERRRQRRAA